MPANDENYAMPLLVVHVPAVGERHYINRHNRKQETLMTSATLTIHCVTIYVVFFFCFPIAFIGLIFSLLCQSAKAAGLRECLSITASILFTVSLFSGVMIIVIISNSYLRWIYWMFIYVHSFLEILSKGE